MKKIINYFGWTGHNNLGDEAIYGVSKIFFSKKFDLKKYNKRFHSKISLLGGGTVIPEWTAVHLPNKYNYAYGVGVRNPAYWGNFPPYWINSIKKFNFRYFGVRGYISQEILKSWGIKSEVIGDPALSLEPNKYAFNKHVKKVGINILFNKD